MEPYFNKMTQTGYDEIETEIEQLKQDRPAKIQALQAARALGDLSENAEYSSAKRDLRRLEGRLRFLNKQLQYAQVVAPTTGDTVEIGSVVTLEFLDDHDQVTYTVVGKQEANIQKQKISFDSALGSVIMHKKTATTVTVTAPNGSYQVKVLTIN